ncbi:Cob(I)yrinic acid a,c-diamide adenosyltransferase, mitochondrial [Smittium culicis]|uniref:Corrinoid adenosyltransferase MMAB n=1 Tax=Smittium culicis TaxID=133412 RepID=A0A1R1X2R8_9FUNG|nr:Cob(I)yrinic acid a,c-diamide adenosyltransferase, mitochondrial [Smittium culicis]
MDSSIDFKITENSNQKPTNSNFKIYTKTGDGGSSSLYTGERRQKNDNVFEALGNLDELNSHIGLASSYIDEFHSNILAFNSNGNDDKLAQLVLMMQRLERVQCCLQEIGSVVASPSGTSTPCKPSPQQGDEPENVPRKVVIFEKGTELCTELESWIDELTLKLPKLTKFILPSGGKMASCLHVARSVCRRAERSMVPLYEFIDSSAFQYINRLSDFLFVAARYSSSLQGKDEKIYLKS